MSEACTILDAPVIGGNVSLYNETNGTAIYPTPTIGLVGLVEDLSHVTTQDAKKSGDLVYLIGESFTEFGGSELQKMVEGRIFGKAPAIDLNVEAQRQQQILAAIQQGLVASAHDVAEGGVAVALAEKAFGKGLGIEASLSSSATTALFSESQSRFVLTVSPDKANEFERVVTDAKRIGTVTDTGTLTIKSEDGTVWINDSVEALRTAWKGAIPCLLKSEA
jgi:phosphoribosylformylglycinamidine synthase